MLCLGLCSHCRARAFSGPLLSSHPSLGSRASSPLQPLHLPHFHLPSSLELLCRPRGASSSARALQVHQQVLRPGEHSRPDCRANRELSVLLGKLSEGPMGWISAIGSALPVLSIPHPASAVGLPRSGCGGWQHPENLPGSGDGTWDVLEDNIATIPP